MHGLRQFIQETPNDELAVLFGIVLVFIGATGMIAFHWTGFLLATRICGGTIMVGIIVALIGGMAFK